MKLSIVIVNYNVKYFLEQALLSVFRSKTDFDFEVFVVDNASVDGSVEMVNARFPEVRLIASEKNLGFSKGNNLAIRQAGGEFVLLLNPDTIIREDTLQQVVSFMDSHQDAGALGVKMIDGQGQFLPESKRGFPSPEVAFYKMSGLARIFPKSKTFGKYHLGYLDAEQTHVVDVLSGAFMLLRKSVLDAIGLLDEDYFMYGEDIDLSYRITLAGFKNYYYPHAPIIHFKGESTKKGSLNYVRVFYQAMIIFARKHITGSGEGIYVLLLQLAIYFRATLALLSRLWSNIGWPLLDALILFSVLSSGKWLWENVVRVSEGLQFTYDIWRINIPLYLSTWLISVYLAGAYDKQSRLFNVFGGMIAGTIVIGAMYGFFPNELRSSRGIIVYGWLAGTFLMSFTRYLSAASKGQSKHLFFEERKLVIVGSYEESTRVHSLLKDISAKREYIGFIGTLPEDAAHPQCLGTLGNLTDILPLTGADEIIFCAKDVSSHDIIRQLSSIGGDIDFKIAAAEGSAIIGSSSKNDTGELLTYDVGFKINKAYLKRLKRFTDISSALALLAASPLLILIQRNKLGLLPNILKVLSGSKTWVAYCQSDQSSQVLPPLKKGILCPLDNLAATKDQIHPALAQRLNYLYAKEYSPFTDLQIIFNALRDLGA
jgi:GT2 family glycosyltransferase